MWRPDLGKYTAHLQQPAPPGAKPLPHASSNVIPKQTTVGGELSGPLLRSWQADPFNRNSIYFTGGGDSMMCTLALTSAIGASWCVCVFWEGAVVSICTYRNCMYSTNCCGIELRFLQCHYSHARRPRPLHICCRVTIPGLGSPLGLPTPVLEGVAETNHIGSTDCGDKCAFTNKGLMATALVGTQTRRCHCSVCCVEC